DGKRITYCRVNGTAVRVCSKGTAAAVAEPIDPGDGVARHPRWLPDGRIVYWFADPTRAPVLIVQEPKAKVERTVIVPRPLEVEPVDAEETAEAAGDTTAASPDEPTEIAATAAPTTPGAEADGA